MCQCVNCLDVNVLVTEWRDPFPAWPIHAAPRRDNHEESRVFNFTIIAGELDRGTAGMEVQTPGAVARLVLCAPARGVTLRRIGVFSSFASMHGLPPSGLTAEFIYSS
jgi:hypothetical protein